MVQALTMLPSLLVLPYIGVLVDRVDRRWLAIAADLFRGMLLLTMVGIVGSGTSINLFALYLLTVGLAVGRSIFSVSAFALVPEVVSPATLGSLNARLLIASQAGYLAGSVVAGLIAAYGIQVALTIDAATFLLSAACLWALRRGVQHPKCPPGQSCRIWYASVHVPYHINSTVVFCHPLLDVLPSRVITPA